MMRRARLVAGLVAVVFASEAAAAGLAWVDEAHVFAAQGLLALVFGALLFVLPVPARWLPVAPPLLAGLWHLARAGLGPLGQWSSLAALVALAHVALVGVGLVALLRRVRGPAGTGAPRALGRTLGVFAAAYPAQALACAALLFPVGLAPISGRLALAFACTTLAPLAAAALACRALRARPEDAPRRSTGAPLGLAALALLMLAPLALRWPVIFLAHERLPAPRPVTAEGLPDVLLVVLDTTRADRLSLYGHGRPTAPALEDLARRATVYDAAVSQAVWTLPSHATIFTGLYPAEHEADRETPLAKGAVTLAEWFREAGYRTGCVASNQMFRSDAGYGLDQGFEMLWCEEPLAAYLFLPGAVRWLAVALEGALPAGTLAAVDARLRPAQPALRERLTPAREVARVGLRWLDRVGEDRPRFLFLNFMEAHGMARRHRCAAPVFGDGRAFSPYESTAFREVQAGLRDADAADLERLRDGYDTSLACMDRHLGELFDALEARGRLDGMLVAVVSDHGEMLGDQRAFGHRGEVWEGLVHVPLLIKAPGQREGRRCDEPQETGSLSAALPALAGLPPLAAVPRHLGSAEFVPAPVGARLLAGGAQRDGEREPCDLPGRRRRPLSTSTASEGQFYDLNERWHRSWLSIRDGARKFLQDGSGRRLVSDPGEVPERARPATPEDEARLEELLAGWRAQRMELEGLGVPGDAADEAARRAVLRRLGYVDGD